MTDKLSREEFKFDVDVSKALTGLKALQREIRKTIQLLRELESKIHKVESSKVSAEMAHLIFVNFGITPDKLVNMSDEYIYEMIMFIEKQARETCETKSK